MTFKKKIILNIGISLGIILLLGAVLFFLKSNIQEKTRQIQEARRELNLRSQITETLDFLRRESEQARLYSTNLKNMFITKDKLVNFSQDLNILAQQNQIDLKLSFGVETPKTETGLGEINISITTDGSFENLIKFFQGLENSQYSVKLDKLDLTRKDDGNFKATLSGTVFYF